MILSPASEFSGKRATIFPLLLGVLLILTGCATGSFGERAPLRIETVPPGAEAVSIEGERCTTPCELYLPRLKMQALWIEKEGFEPLEVPVATRTSKRGVAAALAGNAALGVALVGVGAAVWYLAETADEILVAAAVAAAGAIAGLGGGAVVDFRSGAHRKLSSNHIRVVLEPLKTSAADASTNPDS